MVPRVHEVKDRLSKENSVKGWWDVAGEEVSVWEDVSSLAYEVVLEVDDQVIEDLSWLRKDNTIHINMAELDAVIKELNLALTWGWHTFV